jgi:hypothetical protein
MGLYSLPIHPVSRTFPETEADPPALNYFEYLVYTHGTDRIYRLLGMIKAQGREGFTASFIFQAFSLRYYPIQVLGR